MRGRVRALLVALVCCLAVCVLLGCGATKSDEELIQGEWQVSGTQMTCVITSNQIRMPKNVSYDYTLDAVGKTITYSVGGTSGNATYEFGRDSSGSTTLVLTEYPDGVQTVTTFVKLSDNTQATPSAG